MDYINVKIWAYKASGIRKRLTKRAEACLKDEEMIYRLYT